MISVSGRNWEQKKTNKNSVEKLKQNYNFSDIVSKLVISRKFDQTELSSLNNNLTLNNVFLRNEDYKKSIKLVINAINNKENICILGDYDVDGSAATSLFVRFFESIKHPFFYYIPDREKDGYGASKELFQKLILKKPKLIIMVDCGSTSNVAINYLNKNNIKSLVIDHHEINKPFPKADMIINPKKDNGYIEYDYLCATTLVYFFIDLLLKKIKSKIKISDYLIYALLATVCDVMPIRKLNRLIALKALPVLILGGFTSIPGAIIGGLLIGVGEKLAEIYIGGYFETGALENWFAYVMALVFLLFRPQGLFGDKIIERV